MKSSETAHTVQSTAEPVSFLLSKVGLTVLAIFLLLAAWNGQVVIVILLGLGLSVALLARAWSRFSLSGVSCERMLSEDHVFPGEMVELKLRLINRKLLPLPWVQVRHTVPDHMVSENGVAEETSPNLRTLDHTAALFWYSAVNWRHQLQCNRRGHYHLGTITVTSGDIFGLCPRSGVYPSQDAITVYPRIYPIEQLGLPSVNPIGETRAERRIFEDQTRTIGVREYTPHDSLRYIHWKASARHQALQVKVFEPTTTLKVALFLMVDSFAGNDPDDFEVGVSMAASMANYVIQGKNQAGLYANSRLPLWEETVNLAPAGSTVHLVHILEALARVTSQPSGSFDTYFSDLYSSLSWGTTCAFVLGEPPEYLESLLSRLKEGGFKSVVFQTGKRKRNDAGLAGAWHTIKRPEQFARDHRGGTA